jgi:hypothetical protein
MVKKLPPSGTRLNLKTYFATMPETDQPFHKPHYWAAFTCVGFNDISLFGFLTPEARRKCGDQDEG